MGRSQVSHLVQSISGLSEVTEGHLEVGRDVLSFSLEKGSDAAQTAGDRQGFEIEQAGGGQRGLLSPPQLQLLRYMEERMGNWPDGSLEPHTFDIPTKLVPLLSASAY